MAVAPTDGSQNPPSRPMPAFLQKMMNANKTVICTAKGDDVKKVSVAFLLSSRLRIPIFQRRYCWEREQWNTLLDDALSVANGRKEKHSLGRITCVKGDSQTDERLAVVDGQQRNTTCSLLLAAIRDVAASRASDDACQAFADELDTVLLPDREHFKSWLSSCVREGVGSESFTVIREGDALDFAALVPTYCDRASYFAAILPPCAKAIAAVGEWQRPLEAKQFFLDQVIDYDIETLRALADAVLHKLEWLFFPICLWDGHRDGTEDLHIIYERLAERDAMFCKPSRTTEYASMGAADFVRNLLLGSFRQEADAIGIYKQYWLPIEQAAADAARQNQMSNIAVFLEKMLDAFLSVQPEQPRGRVVKPPTGIGGLLYSRFRRWLTVAMDHENTGQENAVDINDERDLKTTELLIRLHDFAIPHLANAGLPTPASSQSGAISQPEKARAPLGPLADARLPSWRCSRCHFMNAANDKRCKTCSLQRSDDAGY
eukprot:TRINITY_DN12616_c0_g4_i1.p1 TRINITY_DN12616_c0_g4~~TRINITY_DN12616_c0_g4_i1.p1  ORF type:complete len:489 (+),score=85.96 TRINITY_DN12616_c0_g4_i1:205-1671(+)